MSEPWKVVDLINATKEFFEKKGIVSSARLDAELLLAKVLGCKRIDLYVRFDQPVAEPKLSEFRELVRQRGERRPVKQILGRCEFMSHDFEITPDVLIPRPETEALVEQVLLAVIEDERTVVDVGTGSGNIAISLALARPAWTVWATDVSEAALAVARKNAERHGVAGRVTFLQGDLLGPLAGRELEGRVDCVVSNPPYIAESEVPTLMPDVAEYEPRVALVSGEDGLGHSLRIVQAARMYLKPGGLLAFEMSPFNAQRLLPAVEADGAYEDIHAARDLQRIERVLLARKKPI